ncbi:MAG: ribosome silencing factor [Chitinophagales bacterium]
METKTLEKIDTNTKVLLETIIDSILEKKGHQIVSLDLRTVEGAITSFLVICEGNSTTQVRAIADYVEYNVKQLLGEYPLSKEGFTSLDWVLVDYVHIVVHVFLKDKRDFYQLEELWGDADSTTHYSEDA